jgi:D-psicose/D-tagatose/L-ribulose 3-epimerase
VTTRLSASNIAWDPKDDDAVAAVLRTHGFAGVEIAPTKRWESPIEATKKEIAAYRAAWEKRGLRIVAMQALLFGRSDLQLFGSETVRRALREYMMGLIEMAHGLGAHALVFGSPKNRKRGKLSPAEASEVACEFFRELGAMAASRGCVICIEPNPPSYDCDFINTTAEAVALCEAIASRGVKANGDLGAIVTLGEDPTSTLTSANGWLGHFHTSEPELAEVTDGPHQEQAASALKALKYGGWISVEMRAPSAGSAVEAVARAAGRVSRVYGNGKTS